MWKYDAPPSAPHARSPLARREKERYGEELCTTHTTTILAAKPKYENLAVTSNTKQKALHQWKEEPQRKNGGSRLQQNLNWRTPFPPPPAAKNGNEARAP